MMRFNAIKLSHVTVFARKISRKCVATINVYFQISTRPSRQLKHPLLQSTDHHQTSKANHMAGYDYLHVGLQLDTVRLYRRIVFC